MYHCIRVNTYTFIHVVTLIWKQVHTFTLILVSTCTCGRGYTNITESTTLSGRFLVSNDNKVCLRFGYLIHQNLLRGQEILKKMLKRRGKSCLLK